MVLPYAPVPIIHIPELGDLSAVYACDQMKVTSQNDKDQLSHYSPCNGVLALLQAIDNAGSDSCYHSGLHYLTRLSQPALLRTHSFVESLEVGELLGPLQTLDLVKIETLSENYPTERELLKFDQTFGPLRVWPVRLIITATAALVCMSP